MTTEEKIKDIIDKSCGQHNCCRVSFSAWTKLLDCDVFELYQLLKTLIKKDLINIDKDGNVFKTMNF